MTTEISTKELAQQPTGRSLYLNNLRRNAHHYILGTLAMLATSLSEVMIPKCMQWAIDGLSPKAQSNLPSWLNTGAPAENLRSIMSILFVLVGIGFIGRFSWRQFLARQTHYAGYRLKLGLWDVLRFQPLRSFEKYPLGDLMNRAIGDWNAGRIIHGFTLVLSFDVIFFTSLALAAMIAIDWQIALLSFAFFCMVPPFINRLARKEHELHGIAQDRLSDLSDFISQNLRTVRLQRATHCEGRWQRRLLDLSDTYSQSRLDVLKTGWDIFPFATAPSLFAYIILIFMGISRIESGSMSIGEFVAMTSFVLLMQTPLFELGDCIAEWQRGFASMRRMAEIFQLESKTERHDEPTDSEIQILAKSHGDAAQIKALKFAYPDGKLIFNGCDINIPIGSSIGITGEIGSGKTTLIKLLSGIEPSPAGSISIFGHDAEKISRRWFASHVTVVPQHSFLFAGSIRSNLCLGSDIPDDQIWRILDACEIGDEIRNFDGQLDAWVGEWGINLSGGQKQRLSIARALLRPRALLLMDDCLSAVDARIEEKIIANLRNVLSSQTLVWVAHRESTLKNCDTNYLVQNGLISRVRTNREKNGRISN